MPDPLRPADSLRRPDTFTAVPPAASDATGADTDADTDTGADTAIAVVASQRLLLRQGRLLRAGELAAWAAAAGEPAAGAVQQAVGLGRWAGQPVAAVRWPADEGVPLPAGAGWASLRDLALAADPLAGLGGYAEQILEFHSQHRYCGRCGQPTEPARHEQARRCPGCGLTSYPRVAPAVMVLITRGAGRHREVLLARGPRHRPGQFSVIAGFCEPSETLEDCCRREVLEEVGVRIGGLRYVVSQPWPFPHSLMVAFAAEYAGGDITPQPGEIEEAHWFGVDQLPLLPPAYSCAYELLRRELGDAAVQPQGTAPRAAE